MKLQENHKATWHFPQTPDHECRVCLYWRHSGKVVSVGHLHFGSAQNPIHNHCGFTCEDILQVMVMCIKYKWITSRYVDCANTVQLWSRITMQLVQQCESHFFTCNLTAAYNVLLFSVTQTLQTSFLTNIFMQQMFYSLCPSPSKHIYFHKWHIIY